MIFFSRKKQKTELQLARLNNMLAISFANVRRDTNLIFQWLNYIYKKNIEQENTISQLKDNISKIPSSKTEIKQIIDELYSFDDFSKKIDSLSLRLDTISRRETIPTGTKTETMPEAHKETHKRLEELHKRLEKLEEKKQTIKEKLMKKITKNSKEYVKSIILSYIKKYEKISALQLKEMIVDEQGLCSKSSFYRLLEEIEELDEITVIKKGKEKHYLYKMSKTTSGF